MYKNAHWMSFLDLWFELIYLKWSFCKVTHSQPAFKKLTLGEKTAYTSSQNENLKSLYHDNLM